MVGLSHIGMMRQQKVENNKNMLAHWGFLRRKYTLTIPERNGTLGFFQHGAT